MNPNQVKQQIHVSVHIREPLLQAGACATLRDETGIVLVKHDAKLPISQVDVLVVDASAVPAVIQRITESAEEYAHVRILVIAANAREPRLIGSGVKTTVRRLQSIHLLIPIREMSVQRFPRCSFRVKPSRRFSPDRLRTCFA